MLATTLNANELSNPIEKDSQIRFKKKIDCMMIMRKVSKTKWQKKFVNISICRKMQTERKQGCQIYLK